MKESSQLIKKTRKKFIAFSFVGLSIVIITSLIALTLQGQIVNKQSHLQSIYSNLSVQLNLIAKISSISEKWMKREESQTIGIERENIVKLLVELQENSTQLEEMTANSYFSDEIQITEILDTTENKNRMTKFISTAKDLIDKTPNTKSEIKQNITFLSNEFREGIGMTILKVNNVIAEQQKKSLENLNNLGISIIALCVLQIFLIWFLVFRPLYVTITTQHKSLSQAFIETQSANRAKTDFLANISHEIRTPMTAILGYADLLKRNQISQEQRTDSIKIINQNASHLLSLIDEILDISKIEAGKFDFEKENISLSTLLNEAYSLMNVKSKAKDIDLIFKNEGKIPDIIETDPKRLKQILFNLLGNAVKFTNRGYVELTVSFNKASNALKMKIKDTGKGIPKEHLKKIFKPFEQADTSVSREFGGTGLGLVLAKQLAQGLKGDIKVLETEIDKGSTFEVSIDIGNPDDSKLINKFSTNIVEEEKPVGIDSALLAETKILVVDDAKENARLFKIYLNEAGADVKIANDGQAAIDMVKDNEFDIVLLDIQMPGKDGFQVIKELRQLNFNKPVIALTAHAMKEEVYKTKQAGFDDHVTKPVTAEFLIRSIHTNLHS